MRATWRREFREREFSISHKSGLQVFTARLRVETVSPKAEYMLVRVGLSLLGAKGSNLCVTKYLGFTYSE